MAKSKVQNMSLKQSEVEQWVLDSQRHWLSESSLTLEDEKFIEEVFGRTSKELLKPEHILDYYNINKAQSSFLYNFEILCRYTNESEKNLQILQDSYRNLQRLMSVPDLRRFSMHDKKFINKVFSDVFFFSIVQDTEKNPQHLDKAKKQIQLCSSICNSFIKTLQEYLIFNKDNQEKKDEQHFKSTLVNECCIGMLKLTSKLQLACLYLQDMSTNSQVQEGIVMVQQMWKEMYTNTLVSSRDKSFICSRAIVTLSDIIPFTRKSLFKNPQDISFLSQSHEVLISTIEENFQDLLEPASYRYCLRHLLTLYIGASCPLPIKALVQKNNQQIFDVFCSNENSREINNLILALGDLFAPCMAYLPESVDYTVSNGVKVFDGVKERMLARIIDSALEVNHESLLSNGSTFTRFIHSYKSLQENWFAHWNQAIGYWSACVQTKAIDQEKIDSINEYLKTLYEEDNLQKILPNKDKKEMQQKAFKI